MPQIHIKTPLIKSFEMSLELKSNVWLKLDALQPCGSFKARGIGFACKKYLMVGANEFISSSGGNAGLAVAYSGRELGVPVTVVVPKTTNKRAINLIKQQNATVIIYGGEWHTAHLHAMSLLKKDSVYIHPFDDPYIWEGHSTLIDEVIQDGFKPDAIVLSVGGGGLLCGIASGLKKHNLDNIPILAVETQGADSLSASYLANKHISIDAIRSIATSLGAKKVAERSFELLKENNIVNCVVSDKDAVEGCLRFLDDHRLLVEAACGASLSTAYNNNPFFKGKKNILIVVCGGVGVTLNQLEEWKSQHRVL